MKRSFHGKKGLCVLLVTALLGMAVLDVEHMKEGAGQLVAVDNIGAGIGDYVLVAQGSAARKGCAAADAPVDAAIIGIIDDGTGLE